MTNLVPDSVLHSLRKYDTPTVCNVIELLEIRPRTSGYTDSRITACYPALPPMVGFASTATFRAAAPPRGGDTYLGLSRQVELLERTPGPKVVVFQDLDDPAVAATFGEIMATTYQAFGCVGLVSSGGGRDLDQIEPLKFPCFTGGTIPSHGYTQIVELNVPARVGGVWIHPGDLLHGDRNGITTIPVELADLVAEGCAGFMTAEKVMLDYLRAGNATSAGFNAARDEAKRQMNDMGVRLRAVAKGR